MRKVWPWIAGAVIVVLIVALLWALRADEEAYRVAKGQINARVEAAQDRIDTAVEMTTAAVDLAAQMAGDLPSQQAQADLIKQDIEEIGRRLSEAAEARGEAAVDKLKALNEQFDQTLNTIEEASRDAESPAVASLLDRIYGVLEGAQEALTKVVLGTQD